MSVEPRLSHHSFPGIQHKLEGFEKQMHAVFVALGEGVEISLHGQLWGSTDRTGISAFPSGRAIWNEPSELSGHI